MQYSTEMVNFLKAYECIEERRRGSIIYDIDPTTGSDVKEFSDCQE